jgi:hypothetical protein
LTGKSLYALDNLNYTELFRVSTGQLCIEVDQPAKSHLLKWTSYHFRTTEAQQNAGAIISPSEAELINMLSIDDVLEILGCRGYFLQPLSVHSGFARVGALYKMDDWGNPYELPMEILHIPLAHDINLDPWGWEYHGEGNAIIKKYGSTVMTSSGWTR